MDKQQLEQQFKGILQAYLTTNQQAKSCAEISVKFAEEQNKELKINILHRNAYKKDLADLLTHEREMRVIEGQENLLLQEKLSIANKALEEIQTLGTTTHTFIAKKALSQTLNTKTT